MGVASKNFARDSVSEPPFKIPWIHPWKEHLVCKLKKSILQAQAIHQLKMGFTQSMNNPCNYYKNTGGEMFYMGVYIDDIILAGKTEEDLTEVKITLSRKFDIKDLGKLNYFKVEQREDNSVNQHTVLEAFGMQDCKPVSTPVSTSFKLTNATDEDECVDQIIQRRLNYFTSAIIDAQITELSK